MRRMKEVELSLRNVKLLLREKDAHLKEQVRSTGYTGTERVNALVFARVTAFLSDSSSCRRTGKRTC